MAEMEEENSEAAPPESVHDQTNSDIPFDGDDTLDTLFQDTVMVESSTETDSTLITIPSSQHPIDHDSPAAINAQIILKLLHVENWITIMGYSDSVAYILRQTSRFFLGLRPHQDLRRNAWDPTRPIRIALSPFPLTCPIEIAAMLPGLEGQAFCAPCLAVRRSEEYDNRRDALSEMLDCTGCRKKHPAILFSEPQRRKAKRRCIGWEGHVSLCEHVKVKWQDVIQMNQQQQPMWKICDHESHRETTASTSTEEGERESTAADSFTPHSPPAVAIIPLPPYVGPRVYGVIPPTTSVRLIWGVAAFDLPANEVITAAALQAKLAALAPRATVSPCPHLSLADGSLLRPFDPIYCSCLGANLPLWHRTASCHRGRADPRECCLCRSLNANAYRGGDAVVEGFLPLGAGGAQLSRHAASCTDCLAHYRWKREGPAGGTVALHFEQEVHLRMLGPTEESWLQALDPASYGRGADPAGENMFWCGGEMCATGYRGRAWRRLVSQITAGKQRPRYGANKEGEGENPRKKEGDDSNSEPKDS
ncbi:hypothetical protein NKR23_g6014 [Pleurostoma richardsiae]|uniref:Uncharacterized protein n=1 Tax=Pleurostoma richardsiae TaxID=41990 RepID=A0AA38REA3_9PEZI|nr:hypothetical protein NKR23_g6014 [Pleurostoma richardsiae]